jgi:hypothetical protein
MYFLALAGTPWILLFLDRTVMNIGPLLHLVIVHVTWLFENYGLRKYLEEIFSKEPTLFQNLKSCARFTDSI